MASDEVGGDAEGTEKEDSSADRDIDEHSTSAQGESSAGTMEQLVESFATELSNIRTARKRNLMTTSLSVRNIDVSVLCMLPQ